MSGIMKAEARRVVVGIRDKKIHVDGQKGHEHWGEVLLRETGSYENAFYMKEGELREA